MKRSLGIGKGRQASTCHTLPYLTFFCFCSSNTYDNINFYFEFTHQRPSHHSSASAPPSRSFSHVNQQRMYNGLNSTVGQQQYLMRNHTDAITDIVLTEIPYPMIISGDRDGVIKVVS